MTPIQLDALDGDQELVAFFIKRGMKIPIQPIFCKWQEGYDISDSARPERFLGRAIVGQVAIDIDERGRARVIAQS